MSPGRLQELIKGRKLTVVTRVPLQIHRSLRAISFSFKVKSFYPHINPLKEGYHHFTYVEKYEGDGVGSMNSQLYQI